MLKAMKIDMMHCLKRKRKKMIGVLELQKESMTHGHQLMPLERWLDVEEVKFGRQKNNGPEIKTKF